MIHLQVYYPINKYRQLIKFLEKPKSRSKNRASPRSVDLTHSKKKWGRGGGDGSDSLSVVPEAVQGVAFRRCSLCRDDAR